MTGQRPPVATCTSCGDPVIWVLTEAGKHMPVNVEPDETGNLMLSAGRHPTTTVVSRNGREPGQKLHRSHFSTCRNAERHRKVAARRITPPAMPQEGLFSEAGGR